MTDNSGIDLTISTASSQPYHQGDTVTAVLHALPREDAWTDLEELEIVFTGIERVDTAWISKSYRKNITPVNKDARRVQRIVVKSHLQAATQGNFSDADFRRFIIRFNIPEWLPPSFKGTAVRYSYYLEATMRYTRESMDAPFPEGTATLPSATPAEQKTSTVRLPLLIWPSINTNTSAAEESATTSPTATTKGSDVYPADAAEAVGVKCWEIGPGTAIDDAIAHITGLNGLAGGSQSMPHTPSFGNQNKPTNSSSRVDVSETASEISHHDADDDGDTNRQVAQRVERVRSRQPSMQLDSHPLAQQQPTTGPFRSYLLRTGQHPVARVTLSPPLQGYCHPGSTLGGTIEFTSHYQQDSTLPRCIQLTVMLESEETIDPAYKAASSQQQGGVVHKLVEEQFELTRDLANTSFLFTLPIDATPTFQTQVVALKWLVRFQFTIELGSGGKKTLDTLNWMLHVPVQSPQQHQQALAGGGDGIAGAKH